MKRKTSENEIKENLKKEAEKKALEKKLVESEKELIKAKKQLIDSEKKLQKEEKKVERKAKFRAFKIILKIFIPMIIGAGLVLGAWYGSRKFLQVKYDAKYAMVEQRLTACSELVTLKYQYADIVTIKKKNMLSKSYTIIKYSGLIRAGVENPQNADFEISPDRKSIKVTLPRSKILGNEILYEEVFDEQLSIFVPITTQEVFDEIFMSKELVANNLVEDGFLEEAQTQAENVVRQVLIGMGFENVEFF